jgi:glycosyltransferase involved in cell wall biosynthesis
MGGKVQVVVVDNFSRDNTCDVVAEFARRGDVVYQKHKQPAATAEESLLNGLEFAETDYVWSLGDDYVVTEDAVARVMQLASTSSFDFILLNLFSKDGETLHTYFRAPYPTVTYGRGLDMFRDFGLISATTTVSCLCFRKSRLCLEEWRRLSKISPIYSHSVAFFLSFHDRPCVFLEAPCVIYTQNSLEDEDHRICGLAKSSGKTSLYPFTVGLIRLINAAAAHSGVPIADLAHFEEIELSKTSYTILNTFTILFIIRMVLQQWILILQKKDPAFSDSETGLITEFFSQAGDEWCKATIRHALDLIGNDALRPARKIAILEGYLAALNGVETRRFASAVVAPESWKKSYFLYANGVPFKAGRGIPGDCRGMPWNDFPENHTRLTILVPTYNRARNLARLLRNLHRLDVHKMPGVEVLVADNCSTDRTDRVCQAAEKHLPNLRTIHHREHTESAEENIDASIQQAKGDYVWLLGDDDEIVRPVLSLLLNIVWHTDSPCIIFNNLSPQERRSCENPRDMGRIEQYHGNGQMKLREPLFSGSLQSLVLRFGLTSNMAFISRYVLKRSEVKSFGHYCDISPIYSHVFGFLESFSGREVTFVNYPLAFRFDSQVRDRFAKLGDRKRRPYYFPWTNGLIKLTRAAAAHGVVDDKFLSEVSETDYYGNPFNLELEMRFQLIRQLILYAESFQSSQLPSVNDVEEFFRYFREDHGQSDWTEDYFFLLYLKLTQIEVLRNSGNKPSPTVIADLAVIRAELSHLIDCLAAHKPFVPSCKARSVRSLLVRIAKRSPVLEATLRRMLKTTRGLKHLFEMRRIGSVLSQ